MPWLLKPRCPFLPKSSLTIKLPIRSTVPSLVMPDLIHKGHLVMGINIYLPTPYCGGGTVERIATERVMYQPNTNPRRGERRTHEDEIKRPLCWHTTTQGKYPRQSYQASVPMSMRR